MAFKKLATLVVSLTASTSDLKKGLGNANNFIDRFSKKYRNSMRKLGREFGSLRTAIVGAFAASGITKFLGSLKELEQVSKSLGISVESLQRFEFVAEKTGVSVERMRDALREMHIRLQDAREGTGDTADGVRRLGINLDELLKKSPEQQFHILTEAIRQLGDVGSRQQVGEFFFGEAWEDVIRLSSMSAKELADLQAQAHLTGSVFRNEFVTDTNQATKSITQLYDTVKGKGAQAFQGILEGLGIADVETKAQGLKELRDEYARISGEIQDLERSIDNLEAASESGNPLTKFLANRDLRTAYDILARLTDKSATYADAIFYLERALEGVSTVPKPPDWQSPDQLQRLADIEADRVENVKRLADLYGADLFNGIAKLSKVDAAFLKDSDIQLVKTYLEETDRARTVTEELRQELGNEVQQLHQNYQEMTDRVRRFVTDKAEAERLYLEISAQYRDEYQAMVVSQLGTEEEQLRLSYENRLATIKMFYGNTAKAQELALKAEKKYRNTVRHLEIDAWEEKHRYTRDGFAQLASLTSSGNQDLANLGRIASIGSITMDAAAAIMRGYADLGPWAAPAYAAVVATVAAAQIGEVMRGAQMFATGGHMSAGNPYIVGERGPELVIPGHSGQVVPNHKLGDMGANVTIIEDSSNAGQISKTDDGIQIAVAAVYNKMARDIGHGTGIARVMEGKYGLRRAT